MSKNITFDRRKLEELKKAYKEALTNQHDGGPNSFQFEGDVLLISYAKYLIEYLEDTL